MSSPCTAAKTCSPLMQPCHTQRHTVPLVTSRSSSVDAKLFLPLLRGVARAIQAVLQQPAHVFVTWKSSGDSSRILSFAVGRGNTPFVRRRATAFPPRSPVATSDSTTFSSSDGGVGAYNCGLPCVLYSFATHLARTLGFSGCPLSVSAHPVLMGAFPVSQARFFVDSCVHPVTTNVLHLLTSCLDAQLRVNPHRLCCHPNATLAES